MRDLSTRLKVKAKSFLAWVKHTVPPGLRLVVGIVFIIGGVFGFLPILGFWMIPLGIAIALMDIKPIWNAIRDRLN